MSVRTLVVAGLAGLALLAGAAALPLVPGELPESLDAVARVVERLWTRVMPPTVPRHARAADLTGAEREAVATLAGRLDGLVVWSSNRGGDHELYLLDLATRAVRRLTRHPSVDFFSRFSPDGRRVVFLRSQRPWVSFRDTAAWDVHVIGVDGAGERLVARGGYHPGWTPDGRAVTFLRGSRVVRVDLDTGAETLLLDGAATDGIRGKLETPELSPDGRRMAVTVRSAGNDGVGVVDLASRAFVRVSSGRACQLGWTPSPGLVWVEPGGNGGTRIVSAGTSGAGQAVLMDLPGSRSHEYFPRISPDGVWLAWGAAARGHEHDRSDYEIFLWPIGRPVEEAVRLTHQPGNDQWPDIWVRPPS